MRPIEGELFDTDASGSRRDESLYIDEPANPWTYAVVCASSALSIGLPQATIVAIYGMEAVAAAEVSGSRSERPLAP